MAAHVKVEEAASGNKTATPPFKARDKKVGSGGEMAEEEEEEDCCGTGRPRGRTEEELRDQPTASFLTTNARASAYGRLRERSAPYQLPAYKLASRSKPDEAGDQVDYATAV